MIGIRSAISIRARGHRPHLEAVYMTAPRSACRNTKKALAERGPSIHDGWHFNPALGPKRLHYQIDHVFAAGSPGCGARQVPAEDRRQCRRVGEEEIAEARDRNIEMHRVYPLAKGSGSHALFKDLRDHADQW